MPGALPNPRALKPDIGEPPERVWSATSAPGGLLRAGQHVSVCPAKASVVVCEPA